MDRRTALGLIAGAPLVTACKQSTLDVAAGAQPATLPTREVVENIEALGEPPWPTRDPFLFCVHHDDAYPAGNAQLGPNDSLTGRNLGSDFDPRERYRMYHGEVVPGFPEHPHRGFETVTVVRRGLVDHSDSLGAAARYGQGDVQWLTAGGGIVHAEMFPLLDERGPNPLELFQIWLNLPSRDKMVRPHFSMLWADTIPHHTLLDHDGRVTLVTVIAGQLEGKRAPSPPPSSWASRADTDVAIWTLELAPKARFTLPRAKRGTDRTLYFFRGSTITMGTHDVRVGHAIHLASELDAPLVNGDEKAELLLLQGRPIEEPIARRGPFVMNTKEEIAKAFSDYRATGFGGWPWKRRDPVHDREARFARHADGRIERRG